MDKEQWTKWDLLIAVLLALILVVEFRLALTIRQVEAEDAQVEAVMAEAQERIDKYYASLPARERPGVLAATEPPRRVVAVPPLTKEAAEPVEDWYIEDIPLDRDLQKALWDACREFEIDYPLALAVIEQETNYCNLTGDGGASVGYFQIQPQWWGELMNRIGVDNLTDPVDNFRAGCAILRELLLRYDGSVADALSAYNTGRPGTSAYAEAVMGKVEGWR